MSFEAFMAVKFQVNLKYAVWINKVPPHYKGKWQLTAL